MPLSLSQLSDTYVCRLNDVIHAGAQQNGYRVADVYQAFAQNSSHLVNAEISADQFNVDPHPNEIGHAVIADVIEEVFRS